MSGISLKRTQQTILAHVIDYTKGEIEWSPDNVKSNTSEDAEWSRKTRVHLTGWQAFASAGESKRTACILNGMVKLWWCGLWR